MYTNGIEIAATTPFLTWFALLFIGVFLLMILLVKVFSLQIKVLKLCKEKQPEFYKAFLEPEQFPMGLPNTFSGVPIWLVDSWRQTKFFLSHDCKVEDKEVCQMRDKARKTLRPIRWTEKHMTRPLACPKCHPPHPPHSCRKR